jgi:protein involved in polysaccharide export with SLBB domain
MYQKEERPFLGIHEWLAVVFIIGLMGMLTLLSWRGSESNDIEVEAPHFITDPTLEITVEGEVQFPGALRMRKGETVGDALKLAGLKADSDSRKLNFEAKLRRNQKIFVPALKRIKVFVKNEQGISTEVKMPLGARLEDLLIKIDFQKGDIKGQKRKLKDGEIIALENLKRK